MSLSMRVESPVGTIDLTSFLDVVEGDGLDPADPTFTEKVFARSLLKQGGTLALENFKLRELVFPLKLKTSSTLVQNLILNPSGTGGLATYLTSGAAGALVAGATLEAIEVQEEGQIPGLPTLRTYTTVRPPEGLERGIAIPLQGPFKKGVTYSVTVMIKSFIAGNNVSVFLTPTSGEGGLPVSATGASWKSYTVELTPAKEEAEMWLVARKGNNPAGVFYVTAEIGVVGAVPPAYFDGNSSGHQWSGTIGESVSENYVGKAGLTELVREMNTIINSAGATVRWLDEGATAPTFFELSTAQFDPEFKYRMGEQNWLPGKLRLFVQPFGLYEKTPRALALSGTTGMVVTGTNPVVTLKSASQVRGDYAALAQARISIATTTGGEYAAAISVLPNASYQPWWPGGSATEAGFPTAINGWFARTGGNQYLFGPMGATTYVGANRVLAFVCNNHMASVGEIDAQPAFGGIRSPVLTQPVKVPTTTATTWSVVDLGVVNVPSFYGGNMTLFVNVTGQVNIAGIALLPENKTAFLKSSEFPGATNIGNVEFAGPQNRVFWAAASSFAELQDVTGEARGAIPSIPPGGQPPVLAFLHHFVLNTKPTMVAASVMVQERCRYVV